MLLSGKALAAGRQPGGFSAAIGDPSRPVEPRTLPPTLTTRWVAVAGRPASGPASTLLSNTTHPAWRPLCSPRGPPQPYCEVNAKSMTLLVSFTSADSRLSWPR